MKSLIHSSLVYFTALITFLFASFNAFPGSSASANAYMRITVLKSIKITKVKDLDFGTSAQGDGEKQIPATNASAAFGVSGTRNQAYTIVLPTQATLTTGNGSQSQNQIEIKQFTSSVSAQGLLDSNGEQVVQVGATRSALLANQEPGDYSGSFTVTVTYQ